MLESGFLVLGNLLPTAKLPESHSQAQVFYYLKMSIMDNNQLSLFDYNQLDAGTREIVKIADGEFDRNMENASVNFIDACKNLKQIHEALKYKRPGFEEWRHTKPGLSHGTAWKMLNVAGMLSEYDNILPNSKEALYLLAAPSTPEEARTEILERAESGETILYTQVKQTIDEYKKPIPNGWTEGLPELVNNNAPLFANDTHLNEALEDKRKPVCYKCGLVYDGHSCPDCGASQAVQVTIFSHKSVEWYTPSEVLESARAVLGNFDLDPASCEEAQENVNADRFYSEQDDGLSQEWHGKVWLNPPYSKTNGKSNQDIWSQRLIAEYRAGNVSEAILLVKAALGYKWFEELFREWPVCFLRERLSFIKEDGDDDGQSKQGTAIFYLGNNFQKFAREFVELGRVIPPEDVINATLFTD